MVSQAECESCFETYVVIFTYIFRCSGKRHCFNVAASKFWSIKQFSRGDLADTANPCAFSLWKLCTFLLLSGWHLWWPEDGATCK